MAKPRSRPSASRSQVATSVRDLNLRIMQQAAATAGIGLQYVMKEARVFDIWNRLTPVILSRKVSDQARIVCKGETALNKIFLGKLQRFSEDLDFDAFFSANSDLDRNKKIRLLQENIISAIDSNYTIDQPLTMRQVVRFTCSFTNESKQRDSLFIEFNIDTPYVGKVVRAKATRLIIKLPPVTIPVYSFHSLVAKKLKTFYERQAGKDLYDIYRSFQKCKPSGTKQIVSTLKEVLEAEDIAYDNFASSVDTALSDANRLWKVHASTNPYIPRSLRIDWAEVGRELREKLMPLLYSKH